MTTSLQKNITKHLSINNMSVKELERRCGLKTSSIYNIMYGKSKNPNLNIINSIAKEFNCSIEALVHDTNNKNESETSLLKQKEPNEQHTVWHPELYISCVNICHQLFVQKNLNPSKEQMMVIVDETYQYSLNNPHQVDKKFAEWLINRFHQTFK